MTREKLQLTLWKAMQGMVLPMLELRDMSGFEKEAELKAFFELYDNPRTNRCLMQKNSENAFFWDKIREEVTFGILVRSSYNLFEELGAVAADFCYGGASEAEREKAIDVLLRVLLQREYSYTVHCAFCMLLWNFDKIPDGNLVLLEKVFGKHKAGLEARGKMWRKQRLKAISLAA